ncbi:MAG: photosystem I reaction center subunit IV [Deltaproteobacteria bacterium]|nr:photosystem I reaction center subunit IV [Deltaproteobacteria bacterium]
MKTTLRGSRTRRLAHIFLALIMLFLAGDVEAGDFLKQPAFKTKHPAKAALMDITRADKRLVAVGERGIIIYSDDNGESWTQAAVPVRTTLTAVTFPSPQEGWAIGHETVLLHSRDQGVSWEKVFDGNQVNVMMVTAMQAIVDQLRKELETTPESEQESLKLRIEDAEVNLKGFIDTRKEGPIQPLLALDFTTPEKGLLVGAFGIIMETSNGGKNWSARLDRISNPMGYHFYGLARTKDKEFIFGEAGGMYSSEDWGEHWKTLESPYQGSFFNAFGDPSGSLVAGFGLRGNLVISWDDGATWKHRQLGQGAALTGGTMLSGHRFVLVGMAGVIYLGSTDSPEIKAMKTGFPACMAVCEAADGSLILAGLRGIKKFNPTSGNDKVKEVN